MSVPKTTNLENQASNFDEKVKIRVTLTNEKIDFPQQIVSKNTAEKKNNFNFSEILR